ncbi:LINE-1 retrotransposable element ORF2 protein isoform A [Senna tora]|uniref:LINE-1 retrotransposable element ORF2 protein isoform A n=1 Tax=Senna tora TaxID=362788 RepID=A0A834TKF3_9FABA|nr:LINE-1 retrotransposable element ORF2 protein isoform A [Senna tora]
MAFLTFTLPLPSTSASTSSFFFFFLIAFIIIIIPSHKPDPEPSVGDFEFRLEDPVAMLPAGELFSDGKLVPLQLSTVKPSSTSETTFPEMRSPETVKAGRISDIFGMEPYLFSPKASRCLSRWKEFLTCGLYKVEDGEKKRKAVEKFLKKDIADPLKSGLDYNAYGRLDEEETLARMECWVGRWTSCSYIQGRNVKFEIEEQQRRGRKKAGQMAEFLKLVSSGDYNAALKVACSHLGPLAANDPALLKPLKETLLALLRPNEDALGNALPLHALAVSLQVLSTCYYHILAIISFL